MERRLAANGGDADAVAVAADAAHDAIDEVLHARCVQLFGELDAPRMKYLVDGVVRGISGYGNCIGIPTVGGETSFHASYNGNILVNVFSLGVTKAEKIFKGTAEGVGNPVIYVGSKTGRDGI